MAALVTLGVLSTLVLVSATHPRRAATACPGSDLAEERLQLPPGHPPIEGLQSWRKLRLPPGHPPIDGMEGARALRLPPGHPPLDAEPGQPEAQPQPSDDAVLPPGHPHVQGLRHRGLSPSDYI